MRETILPSPDDEEEDEANSTRKSNNNSQHKACQRPYTWREREKLNDCNDKYLLVLILKLILILNKLLCY